MSEMSHRLWEQAIDDAGHTGEYTQADLIALNARLEKDQEEASIKNDCTVLELAGIGALIPTTAEEYLLIKEKLLAISGDMSLREDVRKMSEDTRLEFSTEFPELDAQAREIQLATTQELILAAGLGKKATSTN